MYIGVPSVLLDTDKKRRKLYGKAGCFRLTGYGFEYRVLSSAMMKTPDLLRKIWSGIERSVEEFNNYGCIYDGSIVQEIINKNNTKLAEQFIKELNIK